MSCSVTSRLHIYTALFAACMAVPVAHAGDASRFTTRAAQLDSALQAFTAHFYTAQVKRRTSARFTSIDALASALQHQLDQDNLQQAVVLIFSNLALVEQHINSKAAIRVVATLLEANEWQTATRLYAHAQQNSDRSVVSNMAFAFARQHFYRGNWREVHDILGAITRDLPPDDLHHALLMLGITAQKLQDHRQAIEIYGKIPASSQHYRAAQVNMAVANIRQDWWTDAHEIINKLLQARTGTVHNGQTDRLYTLLGYSFLQQQYYRNSREAFRNVSLDGSYTNRALLGIALTAANQEDYVGALNAVRILKNSMQLDLPVDEAHLLTAYFYEKLRQNTTASAGYTDAIAYYELRIKQLGSLELSEADIALRITRDPDESVIIVGKELVDLGDQLPAAFFANLRRLWSYQPEMASVNEPALQREFTTLQNDFRHLLGEAVRDALSARANYLTSYMNQARYGLARMYDKETTRQNTPQ